MARNIPSVREQHLEFEIVIKPKREHDILFGDCAFALPCTCDDPLCPHRKEELAIRLALLPHPVLEALHSLVMALTGGCGYEGEGEGNAPYPWQQQQEQ